MSDFVQSVPWWWIITGIIMFGATLSWMSKTQSFKKKNWFRLDTIARNDDPQIYQIEFITMGLTLIAFAVLAFAKMIGPLE